MNESRRMFLGTAAAAGVGAATFESLTFAAGAGAPPDAVRDEIRRQMIAAVKQIHAGKAEGARQFASLLRVAAAAIDDREFDKAYRNAIRQGGGKVAVLQRTLEPHHVHQRAAEFGVTLKDSDLQPTDDAGREAAMNALLSKGLRAHHLTIADAFDRAAVELERIGPLAPVARRQDMSWCQTATQIANATHDTMDVICAVALLFPVPPLDFACSQAVAAFVAAIGVQAVACVFGF